MRLRKKVLILLLFFMFIIGGTISLALWNGNPHFAYIPSTEAIDKVRTAEKQGTSIELQAKDINSILGIYLQNGRSKGNITVKGLKITFEDNIMAMEMPIEYRGVHLLLSTGGKSSYLKDENNIEFQPSFYKVGRLPIPKKLVEALLHKNTFKGVEFTDASIKISASLIPFSIQDIAFKNTSIVLALKKTDNLAGLFSKVPKITPNVTSPNVIIPKNQIPTIGSTVNADLTPVIPSKTEASTTNPDKPITEVKPAEDTKKSLSQINSELSVAIATLQNSKERQVLERIIGTIGSVSSNPTYNYTSDVGEVTAMYKSLTKEEKSRVKIAIMSNVDMNTAMRVKNTFGF